MNSSSFGEERERNISADIPPKIMHNKHSYVALANLLKVHNPRNLSFAYVRNSLSIISVFLQKMN
jgi:hypothetical protein